MYRVHNNIRNPFCSRPNYWKTLYVYIYLHTSDSIALYYVAGAALVLVSVCRCSSSGHLIRGPAGWQQNRSVSKMYHWAIYFRIVSRVYIYYYNDEWPGRMIIITAVRPQLIIVSSWVFDFSKTCELELYILC